MYDDYDEDDEFDDEMSMLVLPTYVSPTEILKGCMWEWEEAM